ncbi:FAD/NAD(P)-binding protein [Pyxidicoccus xibeiensis]|uniref:FAD/NAD(P)-binding protein n=1 Tax=Pyxidicoccus xibeiensis TaxID=2906759 RepID=UPI0020A701B1|nr:FAD/NAD(P)-binding protein [Pyxidicoccus xibeiensis]MCP3135829.1 FAD/NAD(P)-binding protein [Pyxidicoccus xibeiensis]
MRAQSCWDVAIIGGGASGTLLAMNLLRSARAPFRIVLVERSGRVGRGLAYSTDSSRHLLNVPAARMGAFPDDPEHFLRWLRREQPDTAPGDFIPRQRYGQYLESVLDELVARAPAGVHLETLRGEVMSLRDEAGRVRLTLSGGGQLEARMAVLALGNALPSDLRVPDGGLYASERYHRSPWAAGALRDVGRWDSVLLIGTGLTMVDTVLSLEERGHQGVIHALSRHGLLPHVHQSGALNCPTRYASPGIRDVLRALRQEVLRECGEWVGADGTLHPIPIRIRAVLRIMRQEVRRATEAGADWRTVVDALRPATVPLWHRMTEGERRRFLRHLRSHWEVHRHRMAPSIGDTVERLRREGRLKLHAARVQSFALEASGVEARLRPRGHGREEVLHVDHVVNCTGPEGSITRGHPLLRSLAEAGRVCPDVLGMGLATDPHGALLDASGLASGRLYTLGPPRRGELWETTAVPEIRGQARELADHLLQRLGPPAQARPAMEHVEALLPR